MVSFTILLLVTCWREVRSEDFEIKIGERKDVTVYGSLETYLDEISDSISIAKSLRACAAGCSQLYFNNTKYNVMFYDYTIDSGAGQAFYDRTRIEYQAHGLQACASVVGTTKTDNTAFYGYGCITPKDEKIFLVTVSFVNAAAALVPVPSSDSPQDDFKTSQFDILYKGTNKRANGITRDLESPFIDTLHNHLLIMIEANIQCALEDADKKAKAKKYRKYVKSIIATTSVRRGQDSRK